MKLVFSFVVSEMLHLFLLNCGKGGTFLLWKFPHLAKTQFQYMHLTFLKRKRWTFINFKRELYAAFFIFPHGKRRGLYSNISPNTVSPPSPPPTYRMIFFTSCDMQIFTSHASILPLSLSLFHTSFLFLLFPFEFAPFFSFISSYFFQMTLADIPHPSGGMGYF